MISREIESLGFKLSCLFYESVDEGDKAAGKTGAMLEEANKNLQYRGANADARDLVVYVAQEISGIAPKEEQATKDGKPAVDDKGNAVMEVTENDGAYLKRVLATDPSLKEKIQDEVARRASSGWTDKDGNNYPALAVDAKARERKAPKPPKLSAEIKGAASGFLSKLDDAAINKALQQFLPDASFTRTGDNDKDIEALGWKLRDWVKAKEKAAVAGFGA